VAVSGEWRSFVRSLSVALRRFRSVVRSLLCRCGAVRCCAALRCGAFVLRRFALLLLLMMYLLCTELLMLLLSTTNVRVRLLYT